MPPFSTIVVVFFALLIDDLDGVAYGTTAMFIGCKILKIKES